jgi:hypothetical protein
MEPTLVKIVAAALALSQVFMRPGDVKTHFDPVDGRGEVVGLLQAGCAHLRQAFGIEAIDIDDLIATAVADNTEILHGLNLDELLMSYRQFCKDEKRAQSTIDLGAVSNSWIKCSCNFIESVRRRGIRPRCSLQCAL